MNWRADNEIDRDIWRASVEDLLDLVVERNYISKRFDASVCDIRWSLIVAERNLESLETAQQAAIRMARKVLTDGLEVLT